MFGEWFRDKYTVYIEKNLNIIAEFRSVWTLGKILIKILSIIFLINCNAIHNRLDEKFSENQIPINLSRFEFTTADSDPWSSQGNTEELDTYVARPPHYCNKFTRITLILCDLHWLVCSKFCILFETFSITYKTLNRPYPTYLFNFVSLSQPKTLLCSSGL